MRVIFGLFYCLQGFLNVPILALFGEGKKCVIGPFSAAEKDKL